MPKEGDDSALVLADIPSLSGKRTRVPASFAQRRLWFVDQLGQDREVYTIAFVVRIRGPLGLHRTAVTSVDRVEPPRRLEGTARLGGTRAEVAWTLRARDAGTTEVGLAATVLRSGALDRLVLRLGGAAWMRRLFAATLAHLAERFASSSARA